MKNEISFWVWCGFWGAITFAMPAGAADFHVTDPAALRAALSASSFNGEDDTIYLAAGTYGGNFDCPSENSRSLLIRGEPSTTAQEIVLDGEDSGTVLRIYGSSEGYHVAIDGMTIENGSDSGLIAPYRGGSLDIALSNVIIQNNRTNRNGGGIVIDTYANVTVNLDINNCVIKYNQCEERGGGIRANSGGGNSSVGIFIVNSLILKNQARWTGGGINLSASENGDNNTLEAAVLNSTISGNISDSENTGYGSGGGIKVHAYGGNGASLTLDLYNTILYANSWLGGESWQDLYFEHTGIGMVSGNANYCNIGDVGGELTFYHPTSVIDSNPRFLDPDADDYHLSDDSLCIDTGDNAAPNLPATDKDGSPRVAWGVVDMGAYEFPASTIYVATDSDCDGNTPCDSSIDSAMARPGPRFIVKAVQGDYDEEIVLDETKRIDLQVGWDAAFTLPTGSSVVDSITIEAGTLNLEKGVVQAGE